MKKIFHPFIGRDGSRHGHEVHLEEGGNVYLMGSDGALKRVIAGGPATMVSLDAKGRLAARIPIYCTNTESGDIFTTTFCALQAVMNHISIKIVCDDNLLLVVNQVSILLPNAPGFDERVFLAQIDSAQKELCDTHRIKDRVDYSITVKHAKVNVVCHHICEELIRDVFSTHGIPVDAFFAYQ